MTAAMPARARAARYARLLVLLLLDRVDLTLLLERRVLCDRLIAPLNLELLLTHFHRKDFLCAAVRLFDAFDRLHLLGLEPGDPIRQDLRGRVRAGESTGRRGWAFGPADWTMWS